MNFPPTVNDDGEIFSKTPLLHANNLQCSQPSWAYITIEINSQLRKTKYMIEQNKVHALNLWWPI